MGPSVSAPLPARPVWQRKALAWSVHLLTASGALIGLLALFATVELRWTAAFAWLGLAALIDGLDGTLARRFDTKQYASGIDGALLDNIVDYFTYVIIAGIHCVSGATRACHVDCGCRGYYQYYFSLPVQSD